MTETPIRLLVVSTTLATGGAQRVTSTLLRHMDRGRIRPTLALLRAEIGYPIPDDVPVRHLGYRGALTFVSAARRLRRLIEETAPDVVLSNVNATNLITGWALRRSRHVPPWVARIGAHPAENDRGVRGVVARVVYRRPDRVVVNSRGLEGAVSLRYPWLAGSLEHMPNPTDFAAIHTLARGGMGIDRDEGKLVVVAVGRLFGPKRYDVMLRAFAAVRSRSEAELWICGDGPERTRLERLSRRLGLSGSVRWLGFLDNPYSVMIQADLFLMTSEYEGLPNALIEAQGLGLPAVSTACPHGPDEIIEDGATGVLVPVGDVDAIARSVAALLDDAHARDRMGKAAARATPERFDIARLVPRWEDLLTSIAGGPPHIRGPAS